MKWDKSAQIKRVLIQKGAQAGIPISGTFELTPRCNLTCKMCYVRLTPDEMKPIGRECSAREWLEIAKEAKEAGLVFLLLTGGEPLLREDFCEIYEGLVSLGLSIAINTNGTMFDDKIKEVFHRKPPAQINITVYGTNRDEYQALCGNPNAYDRMTDALEWLRAEGILVHLNATMIPGNLEKWEAFEQFAAERELELRMTTYCFPPIRKPDCREFVRLSPQDAGELTVKDILYREGVEAVRKRRDNYQQQLNSCKLDIGDPMQCMAAKSQFWMNWNGTMVPCGMLDIPKTQPFQTGFEHAWNQLKEETSRIRLCPECASCPDKRSCMNCAAVVYTETGSFAGKPDYMCELTRAYRKALEKYSQ